MKKDDKLLILYKPEQKEFEKHPRYDSVSRWNIFRPTERLSASFKKFRGPAKAMLFVKYVYFRTHNKFYKTYSPKDIVRAEKVLNMEPQVYDLNKRTMNRIEKEILSIFNFKRLSLDNEDHFIFFIHTMIKKNKPTKDIFDFLLQEFVEKRVAVPAYHQIEELIIKAHDLLDPYDQISKLKLSGIQTAVINEILLTKSEDESKGNSHTQYKGTKLKRIDQSKKLKDIKQGLKNYKDLKRYYSCFETEITLLKIDDEGIRTKANEFRKMDIAKVRVLSEDKKLILIICFIKDQLFKYTDHFVEIILDSIQGLTRKAKLQFKEVASKNHRTKNKTFMEMIELASDDNLLIMEVIKICKNKELEDADKIDHILKVLEGKTRGRIKRDNHYEQVKSDLKDEEHLYSELLLQNFTSVHNKVKPIIKELDFVADSRKAQIFLKKLNLFKKDFIDVGEDNFLSESERIKVKFSEDPEKMYLVYMFLTLTSLIKSGELNLVYSYKFKSLEDYLIPKEEWDSNKQDILKSCDLDKYKDPMTLLNSAESRLTKKYDETNFKIKNGENRHLNLKGMGKYSINTPATDYSTENLLYQYFPRDNYVSLSEILSTINVKTNYLECFRHIKRSYLKARPDEEVFIAGLIALGCNIGDRKMARISKSVNPNTLKSTITWYFTKESLSSANDAVINFMNELPLPKVLQRDQNILHSSSDGSRWSVSCENVMSKHSLKYFGLNKGVNINSHIDERHLGFYSKVISASDREAASVLDGLLHNSSLRPDIHSTDTHGYTEALFAVMTLLGFKFAPRIKSLKDQRLYSFEGTLEHKRKKHSVLPHRKINKNLIINNFDEILRLVATIGTKQTDASQIFKRINSYSNENPTYRALKELGKIYKSLFILDYLDSVNLRQMIEKQLNKIEESQRFSRAIGFGNNQELIGEDLEAIEIGELSRRLIKNVIICWNYLYLTKRILREKNKARKLTILRDVSRSSILHWQHLNFLGEYDFSKKKIKDSVGLQGPALLKTNIAKMWNEEQANRS